MPNDAAYHDQTIPFVTKHYDEHNKCCDCCDNPDCCKKQLAFNGNTGAYHAYLEEHSVGTQDSYSKALFDTLVVTHGVL